ncbi:hypothetical protein [Streptomyces sp. TRM70350]|uniref:hypothetical protein n=1 Tax=Streptomyces sp. TRM70350 TaxID=2856165 RepID=UPI0027DF71EB|nr:hypothetical protein [Streptomyces sp. TRM70350]
MADRDRAQRPVAACFFVFVAGQSTTGQLIARLWSRLAHEAGLAEAWVEEVLQREPPVTTWRSASPVKRSTGRGR